MSLALAAISLGSNLGCPHRKLCEVLDIFRSGRLITIEKPSSAYWSEGVDCPAQPPFLNQVITGKTGLTPRELLCYCLNIEKALGRKRSVPKGPRVIDIDLLFYGGWVVDTAELTLPHPAIPARRSVLIPLAEIYPGWIHPVLRSSAAELLSRCPARGEVRLMTA